MPSVVTLPVIAADVPLPWIAGIFVAASPQDAMSAVWKVNKVVRGHVVGRIVAILVGDLAAQDL